MLELGGGNTGWSDIRRGRRRHRRPWGSQIRNLNHRLLTYFLRQVLHVLPHQMVAAGMIEDGEAPWLAKGDKMRFPGTIFNIEDGKLSNLVASSRRLVYSITQRWV